MENKSQNSKYINMKKISKVAAEMIWRLMPPWVRNPEAKGQVPMFYGTLTAEGDKLVHKTVKRVLLEGHDEEEG